jgi:hypothetical protein
MDERPEGGGRFVVFLLIAAVVAGLWQFMHRPATTEAIEEGVIAVPTARPFNAPLDAVEQARQVRDAINSRALVESDHE